MGFWHHLFRKRRRAQARAASSPVPAGTTAAAALSIETRERRIMMATAVQPVFFVPDEPGQPRVVQSVAARLSCLPAPAMAPSGSARVQTAPAGR
jgi:hypothetical protein